MFFRTPGATVSAHSPLIVRVLVIFGMALLFRMSAWYYNAAADSGEYLYQDAGSFYRTAVHLANGNGYVLERGQEPAFFREPATSYFFAGNIALYAALAGRSVTEPSYDRNNWPRDPGNRNAIRLIRLSQAVLQAIALALFYLLLRHYFRDAFAFTVAALASLYPPLALYSEQLMRENLLVAVLLAVAYLLSSQIQRPSYWKLAALGILWGVAALTLQVYMLLGVFLFAFVLRSTGTIALTAKRCAVIGALFMLTVLPWVCKVYAFYPDVRIAQSLGCALTPDWIQFKTSLQFARTRSSNLSGTGRVPADSMLAVDPYGFTARQLFDNAFSGSFRRAARQLDLKYGHPSLRDRVRTYGGELAWFLVLPGYQYGDWSATRSVAPHDHGNMVVTMFISIVLSVMSLIGLWICCRRATGVLPIYLFHLAFFWLLMSESRRALPIVPFFVLFGLVGLWKVTQLGFPRCRFSILKES
jgi:4-amino-4-deoxy-L-arabinose transferase-like glycosyltransferase